MSWLNPAALFGLLAVAVPLFIHLFGRRTARRLRFPSLRLLQLATPSASSRSQPSDIVLLLLRCAVVAVAALALAQPRWTTPGRRAEEVRPIVAIIVDTSLSMRRLTSAGTTAIERARSLARTQLDSARNGIVIETARPGANIAAASSWLDRQSGLRQLLIISDFQAGAVHDGDLASVPAGIGIEPVRIDLEREDSVALRAVSATVSAALRSRETDGTWILDAADSGSLVESILASPDDTLRVRASAVAARQLLPGITVADSIAVVFPGAPGAGELVRRAVRLDEPSHGDFLLALVAHPLLANAEPASSASPCEGAHTTPLRNAFGAVVASVGRSADRPGQVQVFSCAAAGSAGGTALFAAVADAAAGPLSAPESEPAVLPDELLAQWKRPPTALNPEGVDDTSPDGRWLWLVALGLLLVEEWIRRQAPRRASSRLFREERQRVA